MQETKTTQNSNYEKIMDVFYVLQVLRNKYAGADPEVEDLIKEIENGGCFADNETHKTFALKVLKEFQKIDPHYIPFNIQHFLNGMNSFANSTDLNSQSLSLSHLKTLLTADQPDLSNHIERIHKNVISIALHQKKETPYKGSDCRFQEVLCEGLGITLKEEQEKLFGNWSKKLGALALIIGSGFFTYDKLANNWKFSKEALNEINDHIVTVGSVAGGIVFLSLLYLTYRHYNPARNSQDHEELPTPETKEAKRF